MHSAGVGGIRIARTRAETGCVTHCVLWWVLVFVDGDIEVRSSRSILLSIADGVCLA